jgi:hypothetical protein
MFDALGGEGRLTSRVPAGWRGGRERSGQSPEEKNRERSNNRDFDRKSVRTRFPSRSVAPCRGRRPRRCCRPASRALWIDRTFHGATVRAGADVVAVSGMRQADPRVDDRTDHQAGSRQAAQKAGRMAKRLMADGTSAHFSHLPSAICHADCVFQHQQGHAARKRVSNTKVARPPHSSANALTPVVITTTYCLPFGAR